MFRARTIHGIRFLVSGMPFEIIYRFAAISGELMTAKQFSLDAKLLPGSKIVVPIMFLVKTIMWKNEMGF